MRGMLFVGAVAALAGVGFDVDAHAAEGESTGDTTLSAEEEADLKMTDPVAWHEAVIDPGLLGDAVIAPEAPPEPLDEEVDEKEKPDKDAVWLPGYWRWDKTEGFIWVPGMWRLPPPDAMWHPGRWQDTDEGWVWVNGFWGHPSDKVVYVAAKPPAPKVEIKPPQPGDDYVWVGGYWKHSATSGRYVWVPGAWRRAPKMGTVWLPGRWVKPPTGYRYVSGRWDYGRRVRAGWVRHPRRARHLHKRVVRPPAKRLVTPKGPKPAKPKPPKAVAKPVRPRRVTPRPAPRRRP
ncbi:MAG: BcpO-related WXXGXW repeat protein [bacterium]|nr:BcpO-related WXXGXW repeat protein [bacterium]